MAVAEAEIRKPIPFDTKHLDKLMDDAGIDVLVATSKHNVQYMLGGYRFFFFDTMEAAGTQGTGNRGERTQGPNLDQRTETYDDVLFAIQNGGFSGAIMPQNIVVGDDAQKVAAFVSKYAGEDVTEAPAPAQTTTSSSAAP